MRQMEQQKDPDQLYQSYGKSLYRLTGEESEDSLLNVINSDLNASLAADVQSQASSNLGGIGGAITTQATGAATQAGKTTFDNTVSGYILGVDPANGVAKFYIGSTTKYLNWDGTTLTIKGSISASSIDIPDTTTANSFHVDSSGNTWWGANVASGIGSATASVTAAGVAIFTSVTLKTSVSISGIANNASTDISLLGFSQNLAFTSASATQVNWSSGTIVLSNGRTFAISPGNTGTMAALTYIYLDTAVSTTVIQTTTTYSTAMGANKVIIAAAQNNSVGASVIPFGGGQPIIDGTAQIAALSITAGAIAASTITAGKISVSQLSAIAADMGTLTTGQINMSSGTANIRAGQTAWDTGTGFFLEYNGGTPRFSIGNSAGDKVTWDGTALTIQGGSQLSKSFMASASINANDAVYLVNTSNSGAFDNAHVWENNTNNFNQSLTLTTNTNRILIVMVKPTVTGAMTITSPQYAGAAMTLLADNVYNTTWHQYIYIISAPATGANNVTFNDSSGLNYDVTAWSGYGFTQSVTPDVTQQSTGNSSTFTGSVTTVADGDFIVSCVAADAGGSLVNGANFTQRAGFGRDGIGDTNGMISPAAATTTTATSNTSQHWSWYQIALSPISAPTYQIAKTSASAAGTANPFIGFAKAAIGAGAMGYVIVSGIVTGFSGLTPASFYYLANTAGTIATSAGAVTRKVGIALNSTQLLITNIW